MKENLKKLINALKNDTDGARTKALKFAGTTVLSIAAGILLSKLNEDKKDIIVINEIHPPVVSDEELLIEEDPTPEKI